MLMPNALKPGDTIGIFAPSAKAKRKHNGYDYLRQKGFQVFEHPQCHLENGHTAGTKQERLDAIHELFANDSVRAVMAFWGGANTNQLLDGIDYDLIRSNPKILVGYSDVSALCLAITTKTGLVTFIGPGVISFAKPMPFEYTWNGFKDICINPKDRVIIEASEFYSDSEVLISDKDRQLKRNNGIKVFREGKACGEIVASNLQTLLVLMGTEYFPDIKGKILFLEEGEIANTAMVHRFLTQCKLSGIFRDIKGLVFGRFMSQTGFDDLDRFEDILEDVLNDVNIPVIYDVDFGHSDPLITIPNGGVCAIDTSSKKIELFRAVNES